MSACNVESVHGRGGEMSVRNRMRRNDNDEMRVNSLKFVMMTDKVKATLIVIGSSFGSS